MPPNSGIEPAVLLLLCERIQLALLETEALRTDAASFDVSAEQALLLLHFVSEADGDFMDDVLRQAREALYVARKGQPPIYRADPAVLAGLLTAWPEGEPPVLDPEQSRADEGTRKV